MLLLTFPGTMLFVIVVVLASFNEVPPKATNLEAEQLSEGYGYVLFLFHQII